MVALTALLALALDADVVEPRTLDEANAKKHEVVVRSELDGTLYIMGKKRWKKAGAVAADGSRRLKLRLPTVVKLSREQGEPDQVIIAPMWGPTTTAVWSGRGLPWAHIDAIMNTKDAVFVRAGPLHARWTPDGWWPADALPLPQAVLPAIEDDSAGRFIADFGALRFEGEGFSDLLWEGDLRGMVRSGVTIFVAGGRDGLWRYRDGEMSRIGPEHGFFASEVTGVSAGPDDRVWVGTDRGVALVGGNGAVTWLPVAPVAAAIPVLDLVPWRDSLVVANGNGLHFVGDNPPDGFEQLAQAPGVPAEGVAMGADGTLWAWVGELAWSLHDGQITSWDLGAPILTIEAAGDRVLILTSAGIRSWMPGASQLSPLAELPAQGLSVGPDLRTWHWHEHELSTVGGTDQSWTLDDPIRLVTAQLASAWLATETDLWFVNPAAAAPQGPYPLTARPVAMAQRGSRLAWLTEDGLLTVRVDDRDRTWDIGATATGTLAMDARGLWIGTEQGLHRLLLP